MRDFVEFLVSAAGNRKNLDHLFTPQIGETSYEIIPPANRSKLIQELIQLSAEFPKIAMPKGLIEAI
jgi:hypothetical protein